MTWKTKLPLLLICIVFASYTIIWFKTTSDMTNAINNRMSGKIFNVTLSHRVQFQNATAAGFPFVFGVKLHAAKEDTAKALIHHKSPIFVGYNIFTQELFMQYDGESLIETKSPEEQKILSSNGDFRYSAKLPISLNTLSNSIITDDTPIEILSNMQNITMHIKDASLQDTKDNTKIVDDTNLDVTLTVKHHRTYKNLEELKSDIPKDYDFSLSIHTKTHPEIKHLGSVSLVYGLYLPFNISYNLKTSLHTDAMTSSVADILSGISLRNWESSIVNDVEDSSVKMNLNASISTEDIKCDIDHNSRIKIKPAYAKNINEHLKTLTSLVPAFASGAAQSAIRQLDLSALDLDTKNDPVSIDFKGTLNLAEKTNDLGWDITHFGISFHDISLDVKNTTKIKLRESDQWSSVGVISAHQYEALTKYLVDSYFAIYHLPENVEFNNNFYFKMFIDFAHKIANNITHDNTTITVEYDLQPDVKKAKLGKFGWNETTLLYYATLLKHITDLSKNTDEAITKFKTIVPDYVLQEESLGKIVTQSKE